MNFKIILSYISIVITVILFCGCGMLESNSNKHFKQEFCIIKVINHCFPKSKISIEKDSIDTYSVSIPIGYGKPDILDKTYPSPKIYSYGSSVFYVGYNLYDSPNRKNIELFYDSTYFAKRFNSSFSFYYEDITILNLKHDVPPTIISQGIAKDGTYWKDIRFECICYGYYGVKKEDLKKFEKAIQSFQRVRNPEKYKDYPINCNNRYF